MLIRATCDCAAQQASVLVYGIQGGGAKHQKVQVFLGMEGGLQQILPQVGGHGPISMFPATIYPLEGLLVEEDFEAVSVGNSVEDLHGQEIVVNSNATVLENGGNLKLVWRNLQGNWKHRNPGYLIVASLERDSKLEELQLELSECGGNTRRDGAKVMVLELLVTGRDVSYKRSSSELQVGAHLIHRTIWGHA